MTDREVIRFVGQVLEHQGALIERPAAGHLDAMLSEPLQRELGVGELAFLVEDEQDVGGTGIACGYGTEMLAKIAGLAVGGEGRVAVGEVDLPQPAVREAKIYQGINVALRPGAVEPAPQWLLIGLGRYEATCDDLREGLVRIAVAAHGAPTQVPSLAALSLTPIDRDELPADRLASGFERLHDALLGETVAELAEFREAVARRHRRDAERVDRYFAELADDLDRRLSGKRDLPGLRAKLAALPAERERRRAQLATNHALQVKLSLVGLVVLRVPGLTVELGVRRRKHQITRHGCYDGLAGEWVGLLCEGCGQGVFAFAMCDDAAHVLCQECWDSCGSGGHRRCFRCAGQPLRPWWRKMARKAPASAKPEPPARADQDASPAPAAAPPAAAPLAAAPPAAAPPAAAPPAAAPSGPQELEKRVLAILERHGRPLTSTEIRREIPLTAAKLRDVMLHLVVCGLVNREGQRRGVRYFLADKRAGS